MKYKAGFFADDQDVGVKAKGGDLGMPRVVDQVAD